MDVDLLSRVASLPLPVAREPQRSVGGGFLEPPFSPRPLCAQRDTAMRPKTHPREVPFQAHGAIVVVVERLRKLVVRHLLVERHTLARKRAQIKGVRARGRWMVTRTCRQDTASGKPSSPAVLVASAAPANHRAARRTTHSVPKKNPSSEA